MCDGPNDTLARVIAILRVHTTEDALSECRSMITDLLDATSDPNLLKLLAEVDYLLAREKKRQGDIESAKEYANEAIALYNTLNINDLYDCAPVLWWLLPDCMHAGIVMSVLDVGGEK